MADSPCCQLWMICDGVHGLSERSGRGGVAGGWSSWTVIRPDCYSRLQCNSSWPSSTHSGWWGELTQLSGRGERRSINGQDDCSGSFVTSSTLCWSSKSGRLRGKDKARPIKSIIFVTYPSPPLLLSLLLLLRYRLAATAPLLTRRWLLQKRGKASFPAFSRQQLFVMW